MADISKIVLEDGTEYSVKDGSAIASISTTNAGITITYRDGTSEYIISNLAPRVVTSGTGNAVTSISRTDDDEGGCLSVQRDATFLIGSISTSGTGNAVTSVTKNEYGSVDVVKGINFIRPYKARIINNSTLKNGTLSGVVELAGFIPAYYGVSNSDIISAIPTLYYSNGTNTIRLDVFCGVDSTGKWFVRLYNGTGADVTVTMDVTILFTKS